MQERSAVGQGKALKRPEGRAKEPRSYQRVGRRKGEGEEGTDADDRYSDSEKETQKSKLARRMDERDGTNGTSKQREKGQS